jgi:hypothetical protein
MNKIIVRATDLFRYWIKQIFSYRRKHCFNQPRDPDLSYKLHALTSLIIDYLLSFYSPLGYKL